MTKPKLHVHIPGLPQRTYEYRRGDSIAVYDDNKNCVLIDGGQGELFDKMETWLKQNLMQSDGWVHVTFVLTHWHNDHDCGLRSALNSGVIKVDEIYCPNPSELKNVPKDDGLDEFNRAARIIGLAKDKGKKIVYPAANKKVGHRVGKIRMWMWRQAANPSDVVDYQVNNTSIQVYFPDLEHLETGDAITSGKKFLKTYNWPIKTFSSRHHGNGEGDSSELYGEHGAELFWYSDWEPKGVEPGRTNFSKHGVGKLKSLYTCLRPFQDIDATADGEGYVTWKQGDKTYKYEIGYGAEFRSAPAPTPTPAPTTPKLRDMSKLFGVDVSKPGQGVIDWDKLAPNIDFAILQCGYGQDQVSQDDKQFARNAAECERLGIPYTVYHYSYATSAARAMGEADHTLRLIKGRQLSLPVYYDIEEDCNRSNARSIMEAWGAKIEAAGCWAGLYTFESFYNGTNLKGLERFTKWIAKYGVNNGKQNAKPNVPNVAIWQYSSNATLPGISGRVDVNVMYGDDLLKSVTGKDYIGAARDVWADKYGSGELRETALRSAGYDPRIVQHFVNRLIK